MGIKNQTQGFVLTYCFFFYIKINHITFNNLMKIILKLVKTPQSSHCEMKSNMLFITSVPCKGNLSYIEQLENASVPPGEVQVQNRYNPSIFISLVASK